MRNRLRPVVLTSGLVIAVVAGTADARATGPVETRQYTGPAGVIAGPNVSTQIDGDATGRGVGGVPTTAAAGKLRIQVKDVSGLAVAVRVTAFVVGGTGFQYVVCDATDFVTPLRTGQGKVHVTPLAGVCVAGSSAPVVSAPTTGSVTIQVV